MENIIHKCNISKHDIKLIEDACPGYKEGYTYKIYHCNYCNTSFSFPYAGAEEIYDAIYNYSNVIPGYKRYSKFQSEIKENEFPLKYLKYKEETYFSTISVIEEMIKLDPDIKILEVGSGLGYFTYSLRKNKINTVGLDISKVAIENSKNIFGDYYICEDVYTYAIEHGSEFDFIVANQLIEHVEKPIEFTASLHKMLKPKGRILFTTPNKSIYPKRAIWKTTDLPPVHCFWFSQDSFLSMGKRLNMNVSFFDFSVWYKQNPKFIGFVHKNTLYKTRPIIDKHGNVLIQESLQEEEVLNIKTNFLEKTKSFMNKLRRNTLFIKWKYKIFGYYSKCGAMGDVLCVVLKTNKNE